MFKTVVISIAFLLAPLSAYAGSWTTCAADGEEKNITSIHQRGLACFEPVTGDLTSNILAVTTCENFDVLYDDDQADTAGTADCSIMNCVAPSVSANHCTLLANLPLTGQSPAEAIYGAAGAWIYAVCADPTTETPRVLIHCNP